MQRPNVLRTALTLLCGLSLAGPAPSASAAETSHDGPRSARCDLKAGRTTLTLRSGGLERTAVVYVPRRSQGRGDLPTVLDLHGSQSAATEQLDRSQLEQTADSEGFLVVAPQGAMDTAPGCW